MDSHNAIVRCFKLRCTRSSQLKVLGLTPRLLQLVPAAAGFFIEGYMKLVYGFGVNDADYSVKPVVNGNQTDCPAYRSWRNMLKRCYYPKFHSMRPTYANVKVTEEWRSFMAFRSWWLENQVDGWQLDKDLIGSGNLYSPGTCIYVPGWLNSLTTDHGSARGEFPIGVNYSKQHGKYQARCSHPLGGQEHLGYFTDPALAHKAWKSRKLEIATELKPLMDDIDARIYHRVIETILGAK